MSRRIVIDLYDHTPDSEISDILEAIECSLGIDGAYVENENGENVTLQILEGE